MEERATPGWIRVFLAERRGAQLRSRGALLGVFGWWSFGLGSLSISSSFLLLFSLFFLSVLYCAVLIERDSSTVLF